MKQNFGFVKSKIDGSEIIFGCSESQTMPLKYSYRNVLPDVIDQGIHPICVACSLSSYLNWKINLVDGRSNDNSIALFDIYNSKTTEGEGMTFKDAFRFLRKTGVSSNVGNVKIEKYGKVNKIEDLKYAIILNGPCFGALPVYNNDCEFWIKKPYQRLTGYHAISIVGYDEEGFIIRNSWGSKFCDGGYTKIKYSDFKIFLEVWTVID
jgi:hypothetical protein